MRSAELLQLPLDQDTGLAGDAVERSADAAVSPRHLQQQAADRLAAHRLRRGHAQAGLAIVQPGAQPAVQPAEDAARPASRSARIASAVAERYARSQSYRDFLAAEAQRAIDEANAAAEIAARSAEAVTAIQQKLIADLESEAQSESEALLHAEAATPAPATAEPSAYDPYLWPDAAIRPTQPTHTSRPAAALREKPKAVQQSAPAAEPAPCTDPAEDLFAATGNQTSQSAANYSAEAAPSAGLSVRLYGQVETPLAGQSLAAALPASEARHAAVLDEEESLALDEEIAFRHTPVFDDPPAPIVPIPGNLLEFPRQLVAARKARPRLAEGPLRPAAEGDFEPVAQPAETVAQLRIFEVDPSQISPAPPVESLLPEWSSIHLDAPAEAPAALPDLALDATAAEQASPEAASLPDAPVVLYTAPIGLRVMAAGVDLCLVSIAALGLIAVAALVSGTVPVGIPAVVSVVGIVALLFVLYQVLFFTFSDCTPGMRYARIGLCTFTDENPTRRAMRARIPALILSACPAALGLLWIWLDQDHLAFHDRITRMYQRSY